MVVKTDTCSFSGLRIYPGHGIFFIRGDSKGFKFVNRKVKSLFTQRLNPPKLAWTVRASSAHGARSIRTPSFVRQAQRCSGAADARSGPFRPPIRRHVAELSRFDTTPRGRTPDHVPEDAQEGHHGGER